MDTILTIMRLTFREASRRWVLWVAFILGILFLLVFGIGFQQIQADILRNNRTLAILQRSEMYNFMLMAGLYAVNFLVVMMAVLTSADTLSGEISSGTIHTLVSKPIRRAEIVLGKWLGFVLMLLLYLLMMAGGVMAIIYLLSGYVAPHALRGLGLMAMNAILLLSISLMGGASLSTMSNGVMVFGLYGVAFIGGWIEQFGSYFQNQTAVNVGILCSLIMPSEALWKRAAFEMQSPLVASLGISPFTAGSAPSPLMLVYAGAYIAITLLLAVRRFQGRDL